MTHLQKQQLTKAIEQYLQEHGISQNELAENSGVNAAYIINIRKEIYTVKAGDKTIEIANKWLNRLALTVGFSTEKSYWETQPTEQMKGILAALKEAKENGEAAIITGETGCGKTYVSKLFAQKNPQDVHIVTVGSSDNLGDLLVKICEALKIDDAGKNKSKNIRLITKHLKKMSEDGQEPTLIFDEAEYMRQPALCAYKELYDPLNTWCALVLIGTPQLLVNIEKLKRKNKSGIPQLYRRIRYRIRNLTAIDRAFKEFLKGFTTDVKNWLQRNCDNYGELHDVLVPVLREAERLNEPITVDFIKIVLGIK